MQAQQPHLLPERCDPLLLRLLRVVPWTILVLLDNVNVLLWMLQEWQPLNIRQVP